MGMILFTFISQINESDVTNNVSSPIAHIVAIFTETSVKRQVTDTSAMRYFSMPFSCGYYRALTGNPMLVIEPTGHHGPSEVAKMCLRSKN